MEWRNNWIMNRFWQNIRNEKCRSIFTEFGPYNWIRHYMHFVWCFVLTYVVEGEWLIIYLFSGMIVTSALIIWKGLMCVTGSESPVVVVLSGSMEPGFKRVSWEYFWFQEFVTYWFPQVRWVFTHCMVRGRWF